MNMKLTEKYPSKEEAHNILDWASKQNPEPWVEHCKNAAHAAETIAQACGLAPEKAYVSGLLHDIGYYSYRNGKGPTCHIYAGYKLMMKKGYFEVAKICLTHSFPYQDINAYGGSDMTCTDNELAFISDVIATDYDDYDKLIQLCDCIASAQGMCTMEKRLIDVVMRHGFGNMTIKRWKAYLGLKDYFSQLCGKNIYTLFYDELAIDIFGDHAHTNSKNV